MVSPDGKATTEYRDALSKLGYTIGSDSLSPEQWLAGKVLSVEHIKMLEASRISPNVVAERGYVTVRLSEQLKPLGFSDNQVKLVPGLLIPLHDVFGHLAGHVLRPDNPRMNDKGKPCKYEIPSLSMNVIDCPPSCVSRIGDPEIPLWITEGAKKGDALASYGQTALVINGVFGWRGMNEFGGKTILADLEKVAFNERLVYLAFDNDVVVKSSVLLALIRLAHYLTKLGAKVKFLVIPIDEDGTKVGVDDYLAMGHTVEDLVALMRDKPPKAREETDRKFKRPAPPDVLRTILSDEYKFATRDLDERVFVNGEPISGLIEAEINTYLRTVEALDSDYFYSIKAAQDLILTMADENRFNPIKDYLEELKWDGEDHIAKLCTYIKDVDGIFPMIYRRWVIGTIERVFNGPEDNFNHVLVLVGPQGEGKSYFVMWHSSGIGYSFFTNRIFIPDDKDTQYGQITNFIWELGELEHLFRKVDVEMFKNAISAQFVDIRVPYEKWPIKKPHIASYIATANNANGIFNDPTGSRRYMTAEIININWEYAKEVDVNQIFAQGYALYKAGETGKLTREEAAQVSKINANFEIPDELDDWMSELVLQNEKGFFDSKTAIGVLRSKGMPMGRWSSKDIDAWMAKRYKTHSRVWKVDGKSRRGYKGYSLAVDDVEGVFTASVDKVGLVKTVYETVEVVEEPKEGDA